ncbi:MAG TPA: polysaccharide biosynthesis C-terminal domain-containing protein [Thermoanaerobaculia bacterium]|jgi:O-antigen/teichoic acid export membrane protein
MAAIPDNELLSRVRGVGRGTLATLLGRGFDVVATYAFYAVIARSIPVADFGSLVLGFTILQTVSAVVRLGLDQALLAIPPDGAANRFGAQIVLAASAMTTLAIVLIVPLPPFGLWLAAALPCMAVGQFITGAMRARGDVAMAAVADAIVQPGVATAGALIAAAFAPAAASFALALAVSWAATLLFALRVDWRGGHADRASLLRTGRSMLGVVLLQQATASADILFLGAAAAAAEVAHYGVAQKVAAAFLLLYAAITTASAPFMRALAGDRGLLAHYYHTVTRWTLTLALPLLVVCVAAPRVILALFGAEYSTTSVVPLVVLSLAATVFLVSGPAGSTLLVTGHARALLRASAIGAVAILIAVAALATFGAAGAAAGVLLGRIVARALLMATMRRHTQIELADPHLLLIIAGAAAGMLLTHFAAPWLGALPAAAAGAALALGLALVVLVRNGDVAVLREELRQSQ